MRVGRQLATGQRGRHRGDVRVTQPVGHYRHAIGRHRAAGMRAPGTQLGTDVVIRQADQTGRGRLYSGELAAMAAGTGGNLACRITLADQLIATCSVAAETGGNGERL